MKTTQRFFLLVFWGIAGVAPLPAQWVQTRGPGNGNVLSFAVNGPQVFVGSYCGVFSSTDNGASWKACTRFANNCGVRSLAVGPRPTGGVNLFAGTFSHGLFLSTDEGSSWTAVNTGLPTNPSINALAIIGTTVFAGIDSKGVYRSTDNGASWLAVNNESTKWGVRFLAVGGTKLFSATGSTAGDIFRSTDNGASWTAVNSPVPASYVTALAASGTYLFAVMYQGGVFRSTDDGTSWTASNTGLTNTVNALITSGTNTWAGTTYGGVFLSTDNGASWIAKNNGLPQASVGTLAVSGTAVLAGLSGNGVYASRDNGASWFATIEGLAIATVDALAMSGKNIYVGAGGVYLSTDYGSTWIDKNAAFDIRVVSDICVSGTRLFAAAYTGLFVSTDNGTSWTNQKTYSSFTMRDVLSVAVREPNIFVGLYAFGVTVSRDYGTTWSWPALSGNNVRTFAFKDSTIFAGTNNGVFLSTNNGTSWTQVNAGLTRTSVYALAVSGSHVFAGTSGGGVFRSTNDGISWTAMNTGFKQGVSIYALAVCGSRLFAGTYDDGVFLTSNSGASWAPVNWGLTSTYIRCLAVNTDEAGDTVLYAGVSEGGVWQRALSNMTLDAATVTTSLASSIGSDSATLNGSVNPNGSSTTAWFEYGTNPAFSSYSSTTSQSVGSGNSATSVSAVVSGLTAGTTYYFRVAASNASGIIRGSVLTFTTTGKTSSVTISPNGGFEETTVGRKTGFQIPGWELSSTGTANFSVVDNPVKEGVRSLAVEVIALGANSWSIQAVNAPFVVLPNSQYIYSVWIKASNSGAVVAFTVGDPSYNEWAARRDVSITTTWQQITFTFTVPANADTGRAPIHFSQNANAAYLPITFYIDDFKITGPGRSVNVPTASTSAATSVTTTSATLNGDVNPNGSATEAWFEYGTVSTLASSDSAPGRSIGAFAGMQSVSTELTGLVMGREYFYRIVARNAAGTSRGLILGFGTLTSVERVDSRIPEKYELYQNFPNPFNPSTTIEFDVPKASYVTLKIYNTLGNEVADPVASTLSPGRYKVKWNASSVSTGVYFCRMQSGSFVETRKLVLLK